jgi:hypothetical protein
MQNPFTDLGALRRDKLERWNSEGGGNYAERFDSQGQRT